MARFMIIAASSGIAQALTKQLNDQGHVLFTTARDENKIKPDLILDSTDFDAVEKALIQAKETLDGLDGVVNFSGSLLLKNAHNTSRKEYDETIAKSLTTSFATVRAAGKHMNEGGSVVLLASAVALEGLANHEAIAAAKSGVIGLVRAAAASYAANNLRFNCVAPGLTETSMTEQLTSNETSRKFSEAMHALHRLGHPEDIARAVAFLLHPDNSWITGQVLGVDGGLSRVRPKLKL